MACWANDVARVGSALGMVGDSVKVKNLDEWAWLNGIKLGFKRVKLGLGY